MFISQLLPQTFFWILMKLSGELLSESPDQEVNRAWSVLLIAQMVSFTQVLAWKLWHEILNFLSIILREHVIKCLLQSVCLLINIYFQEKHFLIFASWKFWIHSFMTNLKPLANTKTPHFTVYHLEQTLIASCLHCWSTGLNKGE